MFFRSLDSNNDWQFGKGLQDFSTKLEAIKLNLKTRIKEWKGDCFFNLQSGPDWNSYLDIGTKKQLDRELLRTILQSFGVLRIDSYTSEIVVRGLNFTCQVATIYGSLTLTEGA